MILVYLVYVYFLLGFMIAIWFSFFKVTGIDEAAVKSSFWFRIIIMPTTILLWPLVLAKLKKSKKL